MFPIQPEILRGGEVSANGAVTPQDVAHIIELSSVNAALDWFLSQRQELLDSQVELAQIPAPPFGESERVERLRQRFESAGLEEVHVDEIGNALGIRRGSDPDARYVALTAHVDTVFPAGTPVEVRREGDRVYGPGVSDNGAGLTALLAIAESMNATGLRTKAPLLFIGNVGEEGEGDVRGMRHIFAAPRWRFHCLHHGSGRGRNQHRDQRSAGQQAVCGNAAGSRGNSWSDFGLPNPIMVLARALELFRRTHIPSSPKTTFNVGVISGGTSVIPFPNR